MEKKKGACGISHISYVVNALADTNKNDFFVLEPQCAKGVNIIGRGSDISIVSLKDRRKNRAMRMCNIERLDA